MLFFATLDPIMAILLKEDNGDLRNYLKGTRNQLYRNAKPSQTMRGMALDVAKGMAYLAELKVTFRGWCTLSIYSRSVGVLIK